MSNTSLGTTFDATQVEPNTRPPLLPADWYNVMITDADIKATKANDGHFAEIVMKVLDGPAAGRMIFDRLNLWNANPVAVEIAQKTLSAICHATGVMQVNDLQQLFGKPLMAKVTVRPPKGDYDESNEVKGYDKIGAQTSKNSGSVGAPAQVPTGAPTFAPPAAPPPPAWSGPAAPQPPAAPPPPAWSASPVAPPASPPAVPPAWGAPTPAAPAPGGPPPTPPWQR